MDGRWKIELLGGLQARQGDRAITRFRTRKTAVLLAYLAYYPQRAHSREELIELLWPECDPKAGRQSFRKALSSLRQQLEPPWVNRRRLSVEGNGEPGFAGRSAMPPASSAVFLVDRTAVQINPSAVTTDVAQFERELRTAAQAGSENERALRLARAVELYRGELLPGHYEAWILQERRWLAEAYFRALSQLLVCREQAGDLELALQYAQRAVSADPLREDTHCDLIRLYAAAGQTHAALRQYRELERSLRALGAAPSPEARALARNAEQTGDYLPKSTRLSSQEAALVRRLLRALVELLLRGMDLHEEVPP